MEKVKWFAITGIIVIAVATAAGFGGYTLGKQAGATQAAAARANFLAERGVQGAPGQGMPAGGAMPSAGGQTRDNFAMGQVKSVDCATIQVSTAQEVLTVKTDDQTRIQKMGAGSLSDIQVGERITAQGTRAAAGGVRGRQHELTGWLTRDALKVIQHRAVQSLHRTMRT